MARKTGDQLYDSRVVERYIREGIVARKDYDKFMSGLEDSANSAVESDVRMTFDVARRRGDDHIRPINEEHSEED